MYVKVSGYQPISTTTFEDYTTTPAAQVTKLTVNTADVSDSQSGKYFLINSANNETRYYAWLYIASASTVDPGTVSANNLQNLTGIKVTILTNATTSDIGLALRTAIGALGDFSTGGATTVCDVTNASNGEVTLASNVTTDLTIANTTPGVSAIPSTNLKLYHIVGTIPNNSEVFGGKGNPNVLEAVPNATYSVDIIVPEKRIEYIAEFE